MLERDSGLFWGVCQSAMHQEKYQACRNVREGLTRSTPLERD